MNEDTNEALPPIAFSNGVPPATHILRLPEVKARVGLCRASIYQRIAIGSFPKQISLGARAVGWLEHEIEAWIAERIRTGRRK